jgi:hypothetical protein
VIRGAIAIGLLALTAASAAPEFAFDPRPRWAEDPDTEVVCEAIRKECSGILKDGEIDTDWSYAELYDADGMLVGVRSLGSTGCKPLDEHLLLGQRHFVQVFTKAGQPDLDAITVELAPGTAKDAVRLVKKGTTSVSMGC